MRDGSPSKTDLLMTDSGGGLLTQFSTPYGVNPALADQPSQSPGPPLEHVWTPH